MELVISGQLPSSIVVIHDSLITDHCSLISVTPHLRVDMGLFPSPHLGNHITLLFSSYQQRVKQKAPMSREVKRWSDQSEATLQEALSARAETCES